MAGSLVDSGILTDARRKDAEAAVTSLMDDFGRRLASFAQPAAIPQWQPARGDEPEPPALTTTQPDLSVGTGVPSLKSLLSGSGLERFIPGYQEQPSESGTRVPATPSGTPSAMPTARPAALGAPVASSTRIDPTSRAARYAPLIEQVSREEGVPADVLAALIDTEDSGETSVSPAGARGIGQVVPGQGYDLPGEDASDPLTSIRQMARAARDKYRITGGDWDEVGAAYFGYGTDAGGMTTDAYRQRYIQNRARHQQPSTGARTPVPAEETPAAQQQAAYAAGSWTPDQYAASKAEGLDDETAWAVCGPAAAIAFARKNGRNPSMREALSLAQEVGWTKQAGMAGTASQQKLLERMGIASKLEAGAPDWGRVRREVESGNPVIIDAGDHYMVAERYDPQTGAFDFGASASVLRMAGGRRWFRPDELAALSSDRLRINPEAAIYLDNPSSPTPSPSAGRSAPQQQAAQAGRVTIVNGETGQQTTIPQGDPDGFLRPIAPGVPSPWKIEGDARQSSMNAAAPAASSPPAPWASADASPSAGAEDAPLMLRQPIGDASAQFDPNIPEEDRPTFAAPRPYDPAPDPDQGPRETGYTLPGAGGMQPASAEATVPGPAPLGVNPGAQVAPYDPRPYDEGPREGGAFQSPVGGYDDPGTQTSAPAPTPPPARVQYPNETPLSGPYQGPELPPAPPARFGPAPSPDPDVFDPLAALSRVGESGRKLAEAIRAATRTNGQTVDPWAVYQALMAAPFDLVTRARQELVSDAEARRQSGTDPLAPFRAMGIPLPSAEELNPEGRPASDVILGAALQNAGPDPFFDPLAQGAVKAGVAGIRGTARAGMAGARLAGEGARAAGEAVQGLGARIGEGLAANAERVAAADARMARQGSTVAPGGFGSFEDFSQNLRRQADDAAQNAPKPAPRPTEDQLIREQYGRPWQEVAPVGPSAVSDLGTATDQLVGEGRSWRGPRNRVLPSEAPSIGGPVQIEPQSISANVGPGVSRGLGSGLLDTATRDIGSALGTSTFGAAAGAAMPAESDEERAQNARLGAALGLAAGPLMRRGMRAAGAMATPGAAPVRGPRNFASPDDALRAAQSAIQAPNPRGPGSGMTRLEAFRRGVVRWVTDNRVDLAELQKDAQRALGRPLQADEMLLELSRANPSGAAKVMIDDAIRPALQQAGEDRDALSTLMALLNNVDVAKATGNPTRQFSGGLTAADSQVAAQRLWRSLSPEQQRALDQSSDALYRVVEHYRQAMVDAGVWTPQLAQDLAQQYPHWVPTKIVDYMNDPAAMTAGVKGISLRDRGLKQYTIDGTTKAREDPIASLVRYVQDAETIIQKNEVFNAFVNLRERVPGWDKLIKEVSGSTPAARGTGERTVTGFVNGERKTFLVPAPMAAAIQMEQGAQVPFFRDLTQLFREFITRTPLFVAGQIPLDAFAYTVRTAAREGGPQNVPRVMAELGRGYAEAFRGLLSGEFKGDAARYLREGGAMAGFYERAANAAGQTVDGLTRRNMFEVKNAQDVRRLAGWLATGEWVQAFGSRVEMAPRVAAFRLGERRALRQGASPESAALQGMIEGRDVTLDFQRGGIAGKFLNQIVPFFNVGLQSSVTIPRALAQNPKAFTATALSLVAVPTLAAEAWNRSDPQMSSDYDDVPQYIKDRGIVVMLPGIEGRDERGERRPNYALLPMRELAPIAILSRELAQRAMGADDPRGMGEVAAAMLGAASPIQASSPADLFTSFNPAGLNTAQQLATNQDYFRGGPIATDRRDENASSLSRALTGGYNALTGGEVRPSQTEFAIRDLTGGVGAAALAASDLATGRTKDEERIQSAPVVGGLIGRYVGDAVGNRLQQEQATDRRLPPEVMDVLREAGMRSDEVMPVPSRYRGALLTRAEQEQWQAATNSLIAREIFAARRSSEWRERGADREKILREAVTMAKDAAAEKALRRLTDQEIERRKRREENRRAS